MGYTFNINYIIIFIFLIEKICSLTPFSNDENPSYGFINSKNDLLILNKNNKKLTTFKKDKYIDNYKLSSTIELENYHRIHLII